MDSVVYTLYECDDESIIIRTVSVKFIVNNFWKKNIISLHDLLVCQYTVSTYQQAFSFSQKIQYLFLPIYFLLGACAHDVRHGHEPPDFQLFCMHAISHENNAKKVIKKLRKKTIIT